VRRGATLLAALALAGCAVPPAGPPTADRLSGRLALQIDATGERPATSISAGFELNGNAEAGELRLNSPLGTTLAAAFWGPDAVRLITPQGERTFDDLDAMSRAAFGETLPLRALPDWLHGRPWPGAGEAAVPLQPGPGFSQAGWTVDLAQFDQGRLLAWRTAAPAVRLRAVLDGPP
jgi:outer membrane lipoprotein LolB